MSYTKQRAVLLTLTLLAAVCTALDIREPPSVKEPPADKIPYEYMRRGGTFELPCEATGKPEPTYIWMHDGTELDLNKTNIRRLAMGTIEISDFERYGGDQGQYQCVASNKYGKSVSQLYNVLVAANLYFTSLQASDALTNGRFYKIDVFNDIVDATLGGCYSRLFVDSSMTLIDRAAARMYPKTLTQTVTVLEGTEMKIQCIFSGYPDVNVTWAGPATSLATREESGTRLVLRKMTKEAAGEHKCTGTNRAGSDRTSINVHMHTIPKFTAGGRPSKQTKTEGETATFTCQTTEDTTPQATVDWMINGVLIQDHFPGSRREVTTIQNGKRLTIIEVNRDEDIMVIQCKASNTYKTLYIDAALNVLKRTTLTEKPVNQMIESTTSQIVFVCRATSDPSTPPTVQWDRDGKPLRVYDDSRMVEDKMAGSLTLNFTGLDEEQKAGYSGEYTCTATNGYSTAAHTAVLQYVECPHAREPPSVKEPPADQIPDEYIRRGGKFVLPCEATGKPEPTYMWMHNGKELDLNKTNIRRLAMGTIEISDFERYGGDQGQYQCVASNKYGKSVSQLYNVLVAAVIKFTEGGKPSKQTLTEGETATFTCQTTEDTTPQATVDWMINGVLIQDEFPGARTEWTTIQNGKTLTIQDLNRDEDIKVIQCKASNQYKTVYVNAPLNVLKKTRLTEKPGDELIESNTSRVVLVCRATTDPCTPLVVQWQRDGKTLLCYDDSRMVEDEAAGTLTLNLEGLVGNQKAGYSGEYLCMATNGHSTDAHTAVLQYRAGH